MHPLEIAAHWAWQTSLAASVLIAPALFAAIFLRKPPFTPVRHALGFLVVARLLMPFAVPSPFSVFNWINGPSREAIPVPKIAPGPASPIAVPSHSLTVENKSVARSQPQSVLAMLWMFGVVTIVARVAWQHQRVRKWIAAGDTIANGPAAEALKSALDLANCRRTLRLYSVPGLKAPALFGLLRPSILLPRDLADSGDFGRLRLVCLHEIAHLRRFDVLINWFAIFAQALHWFNPLVWLTLRRLRADQELLCDADVMRLLDPNEHRAYGETLLALASPRTFALSPLIPVSSNFKQLKERIAMIKQFKPVTNRLLLFALPPLAASLAIFTFTAAVERKQPARATVTQSARGKENEDTTKIEKLRQMLAEQKAYIADATHQMDNLRAEYGIIGNPANAEDAATTEAERIKIYQNEITRLDLEIAKREQLTAALKGSTAQQTALDMKADAGLASLIHEAEVAERDLAKLQLQYGNDHSSVVEAQRTLTLTQKQIANRINKIREASELSIASDRRARDQFTEALQKATVRYQLQVQRARPYFQLRRELELRQKTYEMLCSRLLDEQVNAQLNSH